ncbi:hypothetical protein I552_0227 [Mycobacterium xenopi 3993]|nr:hypothetical protein I552_0227 [Mycobacterium xenopi 3993]
MEQRIDALTRRALDTLAAAPIHAVAKAGCPSWPSWLRPGRRENYVYPDADTNEQIGLFCRPTSFAAARVRFRFGGPAGTAGFRGCCPDHGRRARSRQHEAA